MSNYTILDDPSISTDDDNNNDCQQQDKIDLNLNFQVRSECLSESIDHSTTDK
jgi:hypothetical protein